MDRLTLVSPSSAHEAQVMALRTRLLADNEPFDGCVGLEDTENYGEWLDFDCRLSQTYGADYAPSLVWLALRQSDGKLAGIVDYRTRLTPFLLQYGGSIGYTVHPDCRRRGYGTEILRLALDKCRSYGAGRVLLTCDKDNIASQKIILANGGQLENAVEDLAGLSRCGVILRYWITIE